MGNSLYTIHVRDQTTNQYVDDQKLVLSENTALEVALGVFKREVFMMALGRDWRDAKALYLYSGWRRVARAACSENHLSLVFSSVGLPETFLDVPEKLTGIRWPIAADGFHDRWELTPCGDDDGARNRSLKYVLIQ
jgi:hypothetical protein